jgi:hypothetical protein
LADLLQIPVNNKAQLTAVLDVVLRLERVQAQRLACVHMLAVVAMLAVVELLWPGLVSPSLRGLTLAALSAVVVATGISVVSELRCRRERDRCLRAAGVDTDKA